MFYLRSNPINKINLKISLDVLIIKYYIIACSSNIEKLFKINYNIVKNHQILFLELDYIIIWSKQNNKWNKKNFKWDQGP